MNTLNKIKKIREYRHLTQSDMAYQLNIEQSTYSKIENGQSRLDTIMLEQMAEILKVPVEALLGGEGQVFNLETNNSGEVYGFIEHLHKENMEIYQKTFEIFNEQMEIFKAQNATLLKALEKFADKKQA